MQCRQFACTAASRGTDKAIDFAVGHDKRGHLQPTEANYKIHRFVVTQ
jgi:hypothetical protein